jgi:hypothetical protein
MKALSFAVEDGFAFDVGPATSGRAKDKDNSGSSPVRRTIERGCRIEHEISEL